MIILARQEGVKIDETESYLAFLQQHKSLRNSVVCYMFYALEKTGGRIPNDWLQSRLIPISKLPSAIATLEKIRPI